MANVIFSEGSGVSNSVFGKSQEPIKAMILKHVEAFEEKTMLDEIYNRMPTKNFAEKFTGMTALGNFKDVGENGAYPKNNIREGYSKVIEPTTWKNSFEVTKEMIEDDKMGIIGNRAKSFTLAHNRTREEYGAGLLAGGVAKTTVMDGVTYNTASADGEALFSVAHPSIVDKKFKQSNKFAGKFSEDVLDTMQEMMQNFKDDEGNLLNVAPDTIIIPNVGRMKRAVFAAVGSELDPKTPNNALNFQMGLWNVIVWPYLPAKIEGHDYFMMMDSQFKDSYECLPFLDRLELEVTSSIDTNTDANVFTGRSRYGAGFNNWRCIGICQDGGDGTNIAGA